MRGCISEGVSGSEGLLVYLLIMEEVFELCVTSVVTSGPGKEEEEKEEKVEKEEEEEEEEEERRRGKSCDVCVCACVSVHVCELTFPYLLWMKWVSSV